MTQEQWDINHRYEIAIRNMNPNGWAKMTENEKIENLQAIEDKNAMDVGRLPAEVMAEDMPEKQLGYQLDNTIVISRSSLAGSNFPEIIDSIYHGKSYTGLASGLFERSTCKLYYGGIRSKKFTYPEF